MASALENTPLRIVACPDCGLAAEIVEQFTLSSTDGPVGHVALACIDGHYFRMPADRLPADAQHQLRADGMQSDRAAVACLAAGSGAQPSGLSTSRLPGCLGTVGSPAAARGSAAMRFPAAAQAGSAAAGTPRPPGTAR